MKISAKYILAAAFVLLICVMAPAASADSQELVIGGTDIAVVSSTVTGSTVDVTVPLGLYELGFGLDQFFGAEIPTMSLDFFSGDSTIPYEIETFSGVFVQGISFLSGPKGYPLAQNDFTFASSQTSYSGSVPEPSSIALLCAGLAGLLVLSRKKLSFS
ncbi:MAG: PEP-CTERM sorting domain-containing protein [Candidatus Acidiferrales bacterium]